MSIQKHDDIWNEEQLARILNFEPEVLEKRAAPETGVGERVANQFEDEVGGSEQGLDEPVHTESSDDIVGNFSQKNVASDNTQLSQADMFDEPHEGKTKPTFAANPFAKGGAVGLGLLVSFATAGLFLNSIMGTKLAKAPSKTALPDSKPQQEKVSPPPNEIGDYKTQAALSTQAQKLKAVEDARNNRAPNNLQRPEKPGQQNRSNTTPTSTRPTPTPAPAPAPTSSVARPGSASRTMATPARATPVSRPTSPAPTPVSRPTSPAPTPVSRPTSPAPTPAARPTSPASAPAPGATSTSTEQREPTPPVETAEDRWQRLAQLGAYNTGMEEPSNGIIPGVNVGTNRNVNTAFYPGVNLNNQPAQSGINTAPIPVQNTVQSPYSTPTEPVTLAGVPVAQSISPTPVNSTALMPEITPPELVVARQPLSEEEQAILSEIPQTTEGNAPTSVVVSTSTDVQTFWQNVSTGFLEPTAYDEVASINPNTVGIPANNFVKVGQLVPGQLVTPVAAIDSGNRQSQNGNIAQRFVVALSNPLVASDGAVLFPASSQVVFEVKNVQKNGLVSAVGVALIDGQVEYRLPEGSISIRGEDGEPLIAERRRDDSGLFGRDLQTFGLGAAAKVGEVLNRPQRESSYSGFGGGGSTVERGSPNILGAVLEGGFSPVLESNTRRNERAISEIESRPPLWYIEQGKGVQIFINSSFQLQQD